MVKLEILAGEGKIEKISELELERYVNFFENSYKDNLGHSEANIEKFPRWSSISGYYAMHDITKLLFAKKFRIKMAKEVHATAIKVLREAVKDKELLNLLERGYSEFRNLASDLWDAKNERVKAQYYTGTEYMSKEYRKKAYSFHNEAVLPYIEKIKALVEA